MTRSLRLNRRKAAALGIAFASISALALTTTAQADIGPNAPGVAGDIRVLPTPVGTNNLSTVPLVGATSPLPSDGLNQVVPAVNLGGLNQTAASAQIRIHNQWRSGDRLLLQVRDSAGNNCASAAKSIGYATTPTVVSSDKHYVFDGLGGTSPMATNGLAVPAPDVPVESTTPGIKPTFQVNLLSSTQCAPNGVKDLVEILFTNESAFPTFGTAVVTDAWVLTVGRVKPTDTTAPISYNVGSEVAPGPVRNVPLAQNATATPGIFTNTPGFFGANEAAIDVNPLVQDLWTNTAFVLPLSLTAQTTSTLVADSFPQDLGTITLKESVASGFVAGTYRVCYSGNIGNIALPVTATGPAAPGSITNVTNVGNCIQFDLVPTTGVDTVVLSKIFAPVNAAGATTVSLQIVPPAFVTAYLTGTDKGGPLGVPTTLSTSKNSDVNTLVAPYITSPLSIAVATPDRIGGSNRYETAAKIAVSLGCTDIAVLVNGSSYPDALSSTYLAGALRATYGNDVPVLLTQSNSVPQATVLAMRELGVRSVWIVGGNAVVSQQVEDQLTNTRRYRCGGDAGDNNQNLGVTRVDGATRYETNNEVIEAVQSIFAGTFNNRLRYQAFPTQPSKRTALVATGENFADALIAGPIAYGIPSQVNTGFPLVLTTGGSLSPAAKQSLTSVDIEQVVILGGETAVSKATADEIAAMGISVIRLAGANRYATSVAVNNWALAPAFPGSPAVIAQDLPYDLGLGQRPTPPNTIDAFIARGDNFADALASAPIVSAQGRALLTLSAQTVLSPETAAFLTAEKVAIDGVTALGLGSAISSSVLAAANAAVN